MFKIHMGSTPSSLTDHDYRELGLRYIYLSCYLSSFHSFYFKSWTLPISSELFQYFLNDINDSVEDEEYDDEDEEELEDGIEEEDEGEEDEDGA